MPIKDDDERRAYFREYMRRRRAKRVDVTLEDNILHAIGGMNENARVFNKLLKVSALDRAAVTRINTAIDRMMGKWRSIQSTLEKAP
jgi:hypothetical protein